MSNVAIVIVSYNSASEIGECLDAALALADAEIIVVDNASEDDTKDQVKKRPVRLMANQTNRGFAAAVNQATASTTCEYVLLLNPDAVLLTGIGALVQLCAEPGGGAAGGQLVDAEGHPQTGFTVRRFPTPMALCFEALTINRAWPRNPVNWQYRCYDLDLTRVADVDQPAGAFLMFKRDSWERVGGFDEQFDPIWFEDVDFCRRLRDAGLTIGFTPAAVAKHTGGHSVGSLTVEKRTIYWYRSLLRYSAKHYSSGYHRMVCAAVMTGSILRILIGLISSRRIQSFMVYSRVFRLAAALFWGIRQGRVEVVS